MIVLAITALVGCNSAVPVEEAVKAPLSLGPALPVRPPSAPSNDAAKILDSTTLNREVLAKARSTLAQTPPVTTEPALLASFLYRRGVAAFQLGLTAHAIIDFEQALKYTRQLPRYQARVPEHQILSYLAWAEGNGGRLSREIVLLREAIRAVPAHDRGWLLPLYARLAGALGRAGDLTAADAVVRDLANIEGESGWANVAPATRATWSAFLAQARAQLAQLRGDLSLSEDLYRQAIALLEAHPLTAVGYHHENFQTRLGTVLALQGRLLEGERESRRALITVLERSGRNSSETALHVNFLAAILVLEGRFAEAEQLARAGLEILESVGVPRDSYYTAVMNRRLGQALRNQGRVIEAIAAFEAIKTAMAHDSANFHKHFGGDIDWAYALMFAGRQQEALPVVQRVLDRNYEVLGRRHTNSALVLGARATAYKRTGAVARALADFRDAAEVLFVQGLRPVVGFHFGETSQHRWYLSIASEYIELLADVQGTALDGSAGVDAVSETFRLADIGRGQSVQQALIATAARAGSGDRQLNDWTRQEQDMRQRIAALEVALTEQLTAEPNLRNSENIGALRHDLETLRRTQIELSGRIAREFPQYAQLVNPPPATLERARALLRPGEAMIATWVGPERTLIWAVPHTGNVAFATVPIKRGDLCARVNQLRGALSPDAKTIGDIPAFSVQTAYSIYETVLEPVRAGWQTAHTLLIVPDQCLSSLPFALLPTKAIILGRDTGGVFSSYRPVPWLIRSHALVALPSVTSLIALRRMPPANPQRRPFAGFGDPYFSLEQAASARDRLTGSLGAVVDIGGDPLALRRSLSIAGAEAEREDVLMRGAPRLDRAQLARLPRLPDTAEEIRLIARELGADPSRDVFLGERASLRTLKALDMTRYRIIAFATHGLMPGDLEGLTQPALALTAPDVTGVDGDGLLTMEEVFALKLDADWVVLSACNTATGEGAGAEAVSGLGRAFFYAGARALLISNWSVESTSARMLTTELFRRQKTEPQLTRARALQQTLNALLDSGGYFDPRSGKLVFTYAHPLFWAPFTLMGDGG